MRKWPSRNFLAVMPAQRAHDVATDPVPGALQSFDMLLPEGDEGEQFAVAALVEFAGQRVDRLEALREVGVELIGEHRIRELTEGMPDLAEIVEPLLDAPQAAREFCGASPQAFGDRPG